MCGMSEFCQRQKLIAIKSRDYEIVGLLAQAV